ncbi:MAG TPA: SemiSWEET transporter [Patescibacteria group bacterium]|nr:SemiSWEET transporter [Patescibacteria group bacterium]
MDVTTTIGMAAAACTTFAFMPQVVRVWRTNQTKDLALGTFLLFTLGTVAWLTYGILKNDPVIIAANGITLLLSAYLLFKKFTEEKM